MPNIHRLAPSLVFLTLLAPPVGAIDLGGETPTEGDCDDTGRLVCAGMDLGADVPCTVTPAGFATCTWSYGWLTTAYSPLALHGEESHEVVATVNVCAAAAPCETTTQEHASTCAWLPAGSCDDGAPYAPQTVSAQLVYGQCLAVLVDLAGTIEARAGDAMVELATVAFSTTGEGAGRTCYDDDGRG